MAESVRIDKWLWAARFFKTRSLAAKACELGRVRIAGSPAKPSRDVLPGLLLEISTPSGDFEVSVTTLSAMRGPAASAKQLYQETEKSIEARAKAAEFRRLHPEMLPPPAGRPSKRDRRALDRWKQSG